ncbi:probable ATP-dependent RNA helicase DDX56 [Ptychodera flava]|uniref:probable ATP-dependent RNA helicase DDX56 n=1 Tax=Ptychodera flava TaxID=63121 RepID=UPI00396A728B
MAEEEVEETHVRFHEMGLDDRLLKAIAKLGWAKPTLIQERAIPLALDGKDLLARARTGSGKTAAFAIPVIQRIIISKQTAREQCVRALVLTPSRELSNQAHKYIQDLSSSCSRDVRCMDVSGQVELSAHRPLLMEKPDIVVGTPSKVLAHIQAKNLALQNSLEMLVIDEADLLFSFGYEDDLRSLLNHLPKIYQAFLMSATLGDDVLSLKKLILHNPVILKLEESQLPESNRLTQYHIKCKEDDKFLLIYTLIKLRLIRGKTIVFVNSLDKCYRLKLFLEQFSIPACVLNSELPVSSRCHIVNQFNEGFYNIVIAADENAFDVPAMDSDEKTDSDQRDKRKTKKKEKKSKYKKDKEYGVSRGIDFQNVANVLNFDFPPTVDAYIHRVGRTARGFKTGTALSFVNYSEIPLLQEAEKALSDGDVPTVKPYQFKMDEIEGFRYRAKDAMRAVTRVAVKEARLQEIKAEILNSQKLRTYFEDNPRDLQLLRHDKALHPAKVQSHLRHVPEYLVPRTLKQFMPKRKKRKRYSDQKPSQGKKDALKAVKRRQDDPLKSFQFKKPKTS